MQLSYGDTVDRATAPAPAPAPSGAYDWVMTDDIDWSAQPLAGPFTSGTATIGGKVVETLRSSTTDGATQVVDDGLRTRATSGGGYVATSVRMAKTNAFFTDGPGVVVVQTTYVLSELTGSGAYWAAGFGNKNVQGQAFCGVACNWSAGSLSVTTYYDTVSNTVIYSGTIPTEWKLTVYIYQGRTSRVKFEPNVSTSDDVPPESGFQFTGQPVLASNTVQFFGDSGGAASNWNTFARSNGAVSSVVAKRTRMFRMEAL